MNKIFFKPIFMIFFSLGIILSWTFYILVESKVLLQENDKFKHILERHASSFQRELDLNIQILKSLEYFYYASENIDRAEFKRFVNDFLIKFKSIQALEWIPKIENKNRIKYEKNAENELQKNFIIKMKSTNGKMISSPIKNVYYPVYYLEPYIGNEKALGFDLFSNERRKKSLEEAIRTRKMAITSKITLVQETAKQSGILIFIPIWKKEDKTSLKGFVLGVYRISDMIKTAFNYNKIESSMLKTWLVDETDSNNKELLFTNARLNDNYINSEFFNIKIGDKKWKLYAKPSSLFIKENQSYFPEFILLISLLLTFLAAYIFIIKSKQTEKLKNQINEKTKDLFSSHKELETSNKELQVMIHDLKQTQDKLVESEKMASLGGLVAGVAHEINTPVGIGLTGSSHFIEITKNIKEKYEKKNMSEDDFEEYINTSYELGELIYSNLYKTSELVKSFKQISVDQTSENKRKFKLKQYIDEVLISINSVLRKTNITVSVIGDENIDLNSYPGAVSQIITNLIFNSLNHAFKNNEFGTIVIDLKKVQGKAVLVYKDDGKGIPKNNLTKIFDPFFTTNRDNGGTGLGLNIIYNIVTRQLKGSISCSSIEKKGVKFTIEF